MIAIFYSEFLHCFGCFNMYFNVFQYVPMNSFLYPKMTLTCTRAFGVNWRVMILRRGIVENFYIFFFFLIGGTIQNLYIYVYMVFEDLHECGLVSWQHILKYPHCCGRALNEWIWAVRMCLTRLDTAVSYLSQCKPIQRRCESF